LTTSLYVPGTLSSSTTTTSSSTTATATATVLVDIGTGFYVEKTSADAIKFYTGKVADLTKNLTDIEKAVGGKNENLRVVEDGEFGCFCVVEMRCALWIQWRWERSIEGWWKQIANACGYSVETEDVG
jgi:hypothetical protein